MISLASSPHPLHLSESPRRLPNPSNLAPLHRAKIRKPRADSLAGRSRFSRIANPARPISRFRVRSTRADGGATQSGQTGEEKAVSSGNAPSPATRFLSFLCPVLKFFSGRDPSQERNGLTEIATSSISSLARFPWGSRTSIRRAYNFDSAENHPAALQLYEFEACPFCRRVREAMTELDLSAEVYPCPKGSRRHREMVQKIGGKEQFPFLIDTSTGVSMYESGDIVKYLFKQYGQGRKPSFGLLESTLFTGWVPTLLRAGRGMTLWGKAAIEPPPKKLELFSYENNPYARIVREALCEIELPYILHNVGEGSFKADLLFRSSGSKEVPYLVDPNTGVQMGDYRKILQYLFQAYAAGN